MCVTTFQRQITHHTSRPNKKKRKGKRSKKKRNVHSILIWMLRSYGYIRFYFFLQRRKEISDFLCEGKQIHVSWDENFDISTSKCHLDGQLCVRTLSTKSYSPLSAAFLLILTEISYFFHITVKHESYLNGNQYWNFGEKKKRDMAKYTYRLFNERTLYHRYQNRVEIEVEKQFTL